MAEGMSIRLANIRGRVALLVDDGMIDVARVSGERFSSDPMAVFRQWDVFADWASARTANDVTAPFVESELGPPDRVD
jgi:hypothetical protein